MSFPSGFVSEISIIVVIPVYDDPDIFETLDSLYACDSVANEAVGVIVVVNHSVAAAEEIKARNKAILAGLAEYKKGKSACPQIELLFPEAGAVIPCANASR